MRDIPSDLQAALSSGASTLARCWRVNRRDNVVMGFTDHDRDVVFENVTFEPETGLTPSAIEAGTGLSADTHDVSGALTSDRITERDIALGLYDGAEVILYLVDWSNTDARVILSRGMIGQIRRGDVAFEAEVTGLADRLNQPIGRAFVHSCACRLGDMKCGIDLAAPPHRGTGAVGILTDAQQFSVTGVSAFEDGWFTGGVLTWTTGENAGHESHVKAHLSAGTETVIELWLAPPLGILPGDTFSVNAGCDKTRSTCADKFANLMNFRGFPHMPGDDVAASYPNTGGAHDGGSLFRS